MHALRLGLLLVSIEGRKEEKIVETTEVEVIKKRKDIRFRGGSGIVDWGF
jgi:hypothetical protein